MSMSVIRAAFKSDWPSCPTEKNEDEVGDDLVVISGNDKDDEGMKADVFLIDLTMDYDKTTEKIVKAHFLKTCQRCSMGTNHRQRIHESQDLQAILSERV